MRFTYAILFCLVSAVGFAQIRTDVDTLVFSTVKIGYSRDAILRVENPTSTPIEILSITIQPITANPGDYKLITPTQTNYTLQPNEFSRLLIRFSPKAVGRNTALLNIETAAGIKEVFLYGDITSIQPDVFVIPPFIDFGAVALGEVKDTTYMITGGGVDSSDIFDLMIQNNAGGIFFEAYPEAGQFTFPKKIGPRDTLHIHARFTAGTPEGVKTGSSTAFGQVSGDLKCTFRGEVALPELRFTPDTIDFGIVTLGAIIDTFVYVESIGKAPVELESIIPPTLFQVVTTPSVPRTMPEKDFARIDLRFVASTIGNVYDVCGALVKSTGSGGRYRQVILRGLVLPTGLASTPDSILTYDCSSRSVDSLSLTIRDTGGFAFTLDSGRSTNPNFSVSSSSLFPTTLNPADLKRVTVVYTPDNIFRTADSTIIEFFYNGYVALRETVWVQFKTSSLPLSASRISGSAGDYTDTLSLSALPGIATKDIYELEYLVRIAPSDIADIDSNLLNDFLLSSSTLRGSITYDEVLQAYKLRFSSVSPLMPADISTLKVPLRYYVSNDDKGVIRMSVGVPGSEQCYQQFLDTVAFSSPGICGDTHIRQSLSNNLTASFIGMRVLSTDNNFTATYRLTTPSNVTLDWYSQLGELVSSQYLGSISNGIHSVSVTPIGLSSGSLVGRLTAVSNGVKSVASGVFQLIK